MKRWKKFADWAFWIVIIGLIGYRLGPNLLPGAPSGPETAPEAQVKLLDGSQRNLADPTEKIVIVFWATWCPPCKVELARINRMVENNPSWATKVVAVSLGEDAATVSAAAKERGYLFQVGYDESQQLGEKFEIQSTPTILLKDTDNKFAWRSAGVSPSLEIRLNNFF